MSELVGRWAVIKGFDKGAKVDAHQYSDGTIHYTGRTRLGQPFNISDKEDAEKIVKRFQMQQVFNK